MEENEITSNIYSKLKEARRSRGLTVNKLAEKMGENSQKVGRIERGQSNLTIGYLLKISKALNTSLDSIIKGDSLKIEETISSKENPSLLSKIILFIEQHFGKLIPTEDPELKAKLISFIYTQTLKFPSEQQTLFLDSFFETLLLLREG